VNEGEVKATHHRGNGFEDILTLSQPATVTASHVDLTAGLPEIPFHATYQEVQGALQDVPGLAGNTEVVPGPSGGPYTVEFIHALGSSKQPLLEANASGLTPSGSVSVATVRDGFGYATHYHFEYVTQKSFEEHEWAAAQSSPETEFAGINPGFVGGDLPGLQAGETYRYRLAATNATPGNPVAHGEAHTLTVPSVPAVGPRGQCPNESFRSGPSSKLPDCRAYEQVTPHDKEGAVESFDYGFELAGQGAAIGEDGEHLLLSSSFTFWGRAKSASTGPYLFSRAQGGGWAMTAATTQPEAGPNQYAPELFSPDLTSFAFSAAWNTGNSKSAGVEFKLGSPGGPYTSAVSVPRKQLGPVQTFGWLAASEDFSKLILGSEDRTLLPGHPTHTGEGGLDLYEYSHGQFHQANVDSAGKTIGTCGAKIVLGTAESSDHEGSTSSRHAVSADGSRVFFEAVPGSECSKPKHLFVRVDGAETLDLGPYVFLAANGEGSKVLLEARSATTQEVLLYEAGSHAIKHLFSLAVEEGKSALLSATVSEDLSALYFDSIQRLTPEAPPGGGLYREDLASGTGPSFIAPVSGFGVQNVSPDGRYIYFEATGVGALPGAASTHGRSPNNGQVFLYDSVENVIECVSCASPYDPEPKGPSVIAADNTARIPNRSGSPAESVLAANGDYAFFSTTSALLPQDINEEILESKATEEEKEGERGTIDNFTTTSSDVYEWRRDGVDGCAHLQGCIGLISSGGPGGLVLLLGSAHDGRDVFFTTRSQLGPNDNDSAVDIYDARIDGGEPPLQSRPVECEGDACSTPAGPPNDQTPASLAFSGTGNLTPVGAPAPKAKVKPKKVKPKKKKKKKKKSRSKKQAKKSDQRRGK
jgi:hypothetical protein